MLTATLFCLIGLIFLIWSADIFVSGAAGLARNLGISPMMIGLTVVALGTSAPEILVSATAAINGSPDLAVGNALGSNIANIGLVLGITLLLRSLSIQHKTTRQELPACVLVTLLAGIALFDKTLQWWEGLFMLACFVGLLVLAWKFRRNDLGEELEEIELPESSVQSWVRFFAGLIILLISARTLVWGATELAHMAGIPEAIIGLTVIAIGTSLPELAASATSALKGHGDLAIGNVIGSNLFNLLTVLPMPALLAAGPVSPELFQRDYIATLVITLLMATLIYSHRGQPLGKASGLLLVLIYAGYIGFLGNTLEF